MDIGRPRRIDRVAAASAIVVGIGATMWCWPAPDVVTQVGPTLAAVSAPLTPSAAEPSTEPSRTEVLRSAQPVPPARVEPATAAHPKPTTGRSKITTGPPRPTTGQPKSARSTSAAAPTRQAGGGASSQATAAADRMVGAGPSEAVPASISVPFASSHHPDGVQMTVLPHGLNSDGDIWLPGPPEGVDDWADDVSWLDAAGFANPFSSHGAVIIAGHVNWDGTSGALSDLSEYGADDIGKELTVTMTDGRTRTYRITAGFSVDKDQLAAETNQGPLHVAMFGQTGTYGAPGDPAAELRLISCGGRFDSASRHYTSNIVVTAEPVS